MAYITTIERRNFDPKNMTILGKAGRNTSVVIVKDSRYTLSGAEAVAKFIKCKKWGYNVPNYKVVSNTLVQVSEWAIGFIIGKRGSTIKSIQNTFGRVRVEPLPKEEDSTYIFVEPNSWAFCSGFFRDYFYSNVPSGWYRVERFKGSQGMGTRITINPNMELDPECIKSQPEDFNKKVLEAVTEGVIEKAPEGFYTIKRGVWDFKTYLSEKEVEIVDFHKNRGETIAYKKGVLDFVNEFGWIPTIRLENPQKINFFAASSAEKFIKYIKGDSNIYMSVNIIRELAKHYNLLEPDIWSIEEKEAFELAKAILAKIKEIEEL